MPKLYFRYGTMNSSKTANLLMVAHNYDNQQRNCLLLKPKLDTRFGADTVNSRAGLSRKCDYLIDGEFDISTIDVKDVSCILVEECQFLDPIHIDQLRTLTEFTPVICYGLRTDYKTNLFAGSKRLLELADSIEEIKTVCVQCGKKAIINAKFIDNGIVKEGSSEPDLGAEEKYIAMCWSCWNKS